MTSVITGDIINSRKANTTTWLKKLKKELGKLGDSPKYWEIYRGDSFQAEIKSPETALTTAIQIKAALKSIKGIDVRLAIGIGDKTYNAKNITESNGSAFVFSGGLVEELKKNKVSLAIKSNHQELDQEINLYLKLLLVIMNGWTTTAAETIYIALQNPDRSQEELGRLLKIKQNAVSTRLKRACYSEVIEVIDRYKRKVTEILWY